MNTHSLEGECKTGCAHSRQRTHGLRLQGTPAAERRLGHALVRHGTAPPSIIVAVVANHTKRRRSAVVLRPARLVPRQILLPQPFDQVILQQPRCRHLDFAIGEVGHKEASDLRRRRIGFAEPPMERTGRSAPDTRSPASPSPPFCVRSWSVLLVYVVVGAWLLQAVATTIVLHDRWLPGYIPYGSEPGLSPKRRGLDDMKDVIGLDLAPSLRPNQPLDELAVGLRLRDLLMPLQPEVVQGVADVDGLSASAARTSCRSPFGTVAACRQNHSA